MNNSHIQTHFEHIQEVVIEQLKLSESEILAAVAWFTDWQIYDCLLAALERGVRLLLILVDDDINNSSNLDMARLQAYGARIYKVSTLQGTMHHKYCIIDRKVLMMGSYNWTRKAAYQNMESMMVLIDEATIALFLNDYEKLVAVAGGAFSASQSVRLSDVKPRIKLEIRALEQDVALLEEQKSGMVSKLELLGNQLRRYLGALLIRYSELEAELAARKAHKTESKIDQIEYEQAQQRAEQTRNRVSESEKNRIPELNEDVQKEMKRMYREAAMLAHPDRFAGNAAKEQEATRLMAELSKAYQNNDVERVRQLWESLRNGTAFSMELDEIDDIERLEQIRDRLFAKIELLKSEIESLQKSDDWQTYTQHADNLTAYFDKVKVDLELRISVLEKQLR